MRGRCQCNALSPPHILEKAPLKKGRGEFSSPTKAVMPFPTAEGSAYASQCLPPGGDHGSLS